MLARPVPDTQLQGELISFLMEIKGIHRNTITWSYKPKIIGGGGTHNTKTEK
jgi:hypothetical protein